MKGYLLYTYIYNKMIKKTTVDSCHKRFDRNGIADAHKTRTIDYSFDKSTLEKN